MSEPSLIIIGSGIAAYTLAREFRKRDPETPLTLITRDQGQNYSKPMLSNALAMGKTASDLAAKSTEEMALQLNARILPGREVLRLDRESKTVVTSEGELSYTRLVLAVGADQISVPMEGDGVKDVHQVNDLDTYAAFRNELPEQGRVLIIGAGLIGCEFANDLIQAGCKVSLVDLAVQPLSRLLPAELGTLLKQRLEEDGVSWYLGNQVTAVTRQNNGFCIQLASGEELETDVVLSAVGLRSRTRLASEAGLEVNRGVVVDQTLSTSDPAIFSLGDCAEIDGVVRPYILPVMTSARALAATLSGTPTPVIFPCMPVTVKTPSCPMVVAPPEETGLEGAWTVSGDTPDLIGRFETPEGALKGFALTGICTKQRQALIKEMSE